MAEEAYTQRQHDRINRPTQVHDESPVTAIAQFFCKVGEKWQYNPEIVTELEVQFTADGSGKTRVDLEHRNLDRLGEHAEMAFAAFDSPAGWQGVLDSFVRVAEAA